MVSKNFHDVISMISYFNGGKKMSKCDFINELDASITVCNTEGMIIDMNQKAIQTWEKYGGEELIGKNLIDCHPEPAKSKLKELLATQNSSTYTIEKNGVKKIIFQKPWYEEGIYKGFTEIVFEIPFDIPHFIRKS